MVWCGVVWCGVVLAKPSEIIWPNTESNTPVPIMYIFMMTNKRELKKRRMLSDFAGIIRNLTYHSTVVTGVGQVDDAPRGGALVVLLHYGT